MERRKRKRGRGVRQRCLDSPQIRLLPLSCYLLVDQTALGVALPLLYRARQLARTYPYGKGGVRRTPHSEFVRPDLSASVFRQV